MNSIICHKFRTYVFKVCLLVKVCDLDVGGLWGVRSLSLDQLVKLLPPEETLTRGTEGKEGRE